MLSPYHRRASTGSNTPLLDDLQLRPRLGAGPTAPAFLVGRSRTFGRLGPEVRFREHHPLSRLPCINSHHRSDRETHVVNNTREARVKFNLFVTQLQTLRRTWAEIENNLAFLDVRLGHFGARAFGVNDDVRSMSTVRHPLMHCSQQIGTLGWCWWRRC